MEITRGSVHIRTYYHFFSKSLHVTFLECRPVANYLKARVKWGRTYLLKFGEPFKTTTNLDSLRHKLFIDWHCELLYLEIILFYQLKLVEIVSTVNLFKKLTQIRWINQY